MNDQLYIVQQTQIPRPACRWPYDTEMDLKVIECKCVELTNLVKNRADVSTEMIHQFLQTEERFVSSWVAQHIQVNA